MPKKKKAFIDRKRAQHFCLVAKSKADRDRDGDDATHYVLVPVKYQQDAKASEIQLDGHLADIDPDAEQDHINGLGLPNDGYDYERHLSSMGGGTFVSAAPDKDALNRQLSAQQRSEAENAEETATKKLQGITLSEAAMDQDLFDALYGEAEGDFEELNDDFLLQAGGEQSEGIEEWKVEADEAFDEREFMAARIAASRQSMAYQALAAEFSDEEEDEEEAKLDHSRRPLTEAEKLLAREFDVTMLGYESDDIGEMEDPEDCVDPERALDPFDDERLDDLLDEFIKEQKPITLTFSATTEADGDASDGEVPTLTPIPEASVEKKDGEEVYAGSEASEASHDAEAREDEADEAEEAADAFDEELAPLEQILNQQPYLKPKEVEEWDCESVLSTLSTTDNLPTMISHPRRKPRKERRTRSANAEAGEAEELPSQIVLSQKTGMPLGVLPGLEKSEREKQANLGAPRDREESKEDKRSRKAAIKAERKAARARKKAMRTAMKT